MGERLESWKEIATYLGREVRTVQRWALDRGLPVHRLPGGDRPRVFSLKSEVDAWLKAGPSHPRDGQASVAVLPFLNLSGDAAGQYFGDGLADDVINALVRIPGLRVTARTSSFAFPERGRDVREIGRRLGTAWLIEGSVRRNGDRTRVSAQLVNTGDGFHAWSEVFDRKSADAFSIQDEIAEAIASALKVNLAAGEPSVPPTRDVEAYDLWVKGRSVSYQFTPQAIAQARACYEAAIARDPAFARPHFGLADLLFNGVQFGLTTSPDVLPTIRSAIAQSLRLDDTSAEAHALMGVIRGILDYDWEGAAASFRRALELGPGSATVMIQHAWYHLVPRMHIVQAVAEASEAVTLDPLSPRVHGQLGLVWMTARDYTRAAEECRVAVDLAPGLWWAHWMYGTALLLQGRFVQGLRESRRLYDEIHHPMVVGAMALVSGLMLRRNLARKFLEELETMSHTMEVPPTAFALAYIGLGDDRMFDWLSKAIDARDPVMTHLPSMPLYDGIRHDPRFTALLVRMNLA